MKHFGLFILDLTKFVMFLSVFRTRAERCNVKWERYNWVLLALLLVELVQRLKELFIKGKKCPLQLHWLVRRFLQISFIGGIMPILCPAFLIVPVWKFSMTFLWFLKREAKSFLTFWLSIFGSDNKNFVWRDNAFRSFWWNEEIWTLTGSGIILFGCSSAWGIGGLDGNLLLLKEGKC